MKTGIISSTDCRAHLRFDGSYHLSDSVVYERIISKHNHVPLHSLCSKIFTSARGRRVYTNSSKGYPFLSNSDVVSSDPFATCKYNSIKYSNDKDSFLKEGMIVTGRVGAIGQTAYINKEFEQKNAIESDNIIRIICNDDIPNGYVYSYLASKVGNVMFWKHAAGGVQPYITDGMVSQIPIPQFPAEFQSKIDKQIKDAAALRVDANKLLEEARTLLLKDAGLKDLTPEDYDYYGPRVSGRKVSCFVRNKKDIDTITINAFNHSERIRKTKASMPCQTVPLKDVLLGGDTFSSYSVPSIEVKPEHGIMFINQKDIFDNIVKGKWVSKRNVSLDKLVEYGEVIVACDGTLGESELFCRTLFANEDLQGALMSTHFIRMKTNESVPSGYLYAWLSSDYGFRFIRNCQAGTKLCHPIPKMFLQIPVPILAKEIMNAIDEKVPNALTLRYKANTLERSAIKAVEQEIDGWGK